LTRELCTISMAYAYCRAAAGFTKLFTMLSAK
jgi:hypothetical protein